MEKLIIALLLFTFVGVGNCEAWNIHEYHQDILEQQELQRQGYEIERQTRELQRQTEILEQQQYDRKRQERQDWFHDRFGDPFSN